MIYNYTIIYYIIFIYLSLYICVYIYIYYNIYIFPIEAFCLDTSCRILSGTFWVLSFRLFDSARHCESSMISRDIANFPSELRRPRSGVFAEVARLMPPEKHYIQCICYYITYYVLLLLYICLLSYYYSYYYHQISILLLCLSESHGWPGCGGSSSRRAT